MRFSITALLVATLVAACSRRDAGTRAASDTSQRSTTMAKTLTQLSLTSAGFKDGAAIPVQFTCDGANQSPPLTWADAPDNTVSYALIVEDPDAPGGTFIHWVIYDIPVATHSLPQGVPNGPTVPALGGAKQGRNSFKNAVGYGGPCPPKGAPHHYHFKLFALDKTLGLEPGATRDQAMDTMRGHELAHGELVGTYARKS